MKTSTGYQSVKVGKISEAKLRKALKGGSLTLSSADLKPSDFNLLLHPENAKKVIAAQKANKGARLSIARGEIENDLNELQGGSLWSFLKDTVWPIAKKVIGVAADGVTYANPQLAPIREGVRSLTGVGLKKGSPEMRQKMAALRAKRGSKTLHGASFRLN
jgi:hypothetical protein